LFDAIASNPYHEAMATDEIAVKEIPGGRQLTHETPHRRPRARRKLGWSVLALIGLLLVGGASLFFLTRGDEKGEKNKATSAGGISEALGRLTRVVVVKPLRGGMERVTDQPGTIRAFEYAGIYPKISGFIKTRYVDRGDRVNKGDLLIEIYDPERDVAVLQAQAVLDHTRAREKQAETSVKAAKAAVQVAAAKQAEAEAVAEEKRYDEVWHKIQYDRIFALRERDAIEGKLVDQRREEWNASRASVQAAAAGVRTAAEALLEARAKVEQAEADVKEAQAQIQVRAAELELAKVFQQYTQIRSPYTGVVTFRGEAVHPGAFVRSATEGQGEPLLTVARTDKMRTIILVPDRDVPYCKAGLPATIQLDALGGRVFTGTVSLTAESEDVNDRNMRVEVDLDNPDGVLKDGYFGRAVILLEKVVKNLTIPSSCLIERNGRGDASVLVVKNGEVHRVKLRVGIDNGLRVEVIKGLEEGDLVILQPDESMADGTKVQVEIKPRDQSQAPRGASA
jgi:RND family efflux transporter MFP subunit